MVSFKDRETVKQELVSSGYTLEYLDEWPPKTTLYRHTDGLNTVGDIVKPYGSTVEGVPGNPDYVLRKARIGWFPYPPSNACTCRWCAERAVESQRLEEIPDDYKCDNAECDFVASSDSHAGKLSGLRMHIRNSH